MSTTSKPTTADAAAHASCAGIRDDDPVLLVGLTDTTELSWNQ
jgi:hypothetical protein